MTVTESPGVTVGPSGAAPLAEVSGVTSVEPLQHRFACVGADLQNLYGVRPQTIGVAGKLQDGWFQGGTASQLTSTLAKRPDMRNGRAGRHRDAARPAPPAIDELRDL